MITPAQALPDTLRLYGFLPQFVQDNDAAGGYQFLSWLDGFISEGSQESTLTYNYDYSDGIITPIESPVTVNNSPVPAMTGIQAIDDVVRDTQYFPGWSSILDVNRCPEYALPWLGQLVGVRLSQTLADGAKRRAIINECPFDRGTVAYIEYHANLWMTPPYKVTLLERTSFIASSFAVDPYAVTVTYPLAGVNALTYAELFANYSDYAVVQSDFANYAAMSGDETNLEAAVTAVMPAGLFVYFNPV